MKRMPSWFLAVEAAVLMLVGVALVSTAASDHASLMPAPVLWVLVVLAALMLVAILLELIRRKTRGR